MALKYLRDNLKSLTWVLWGVVAVFILLVFFEWGGVNDRQSMGLDIAATVGDEKITYGEFQQTYRGLEDRYRQTFGAQFDREMAKQFNLPVQALDQLINERILLMEARDIGLRATDEEVRDAILEHPAFQDENGEFIGTERYQELLRLNRLTSSTFEDDVRKDVLRSKLNSILAQTAYISDAELEKSYREQAEKAQISYVQLPASQFAAEVSVTPEEVAAYFAEHQDDYELPEQRVVDYLMVDNATLRAEIEIPDEDLVTYYESNQDDYTREEQVRARHILLRVTPDRPENQAESLLQNIRQRVEAGEDFADLAKEFSDDESNSGRGGNLGFFGRGRMVKAFEDAAFNASPGDLLGPVKTDFGYHLIDVQDRREAGLQPFEQVRGAVRARLLNERVQEIAESKIRDLAQRIDTEQLSTKEQLDNLATEEGLEWKKTEPFGSTDTILGIGRMPDFNQAAFDLDLGAMSQPLKLPRGWAVLQLAEIQDPRLPELDEVEAQVRQDTEQQKRKAAAAQKLEEMKRSVASGGDFNQLASDLGLEPQESGEFGRGGNITGLGANREVIDGALGLDIGQLGGPFQSDLGAVLFTVTDRKIFDPAEFEKDKEITRSGQETERLGELIASLIEHRRRDLTPQYDAQVLANFGIEPPDA
ncbi:MAG: SurA N-terminal domain-containing protein [Acidobacteriota bacterium]